MNEEKSKHGSHRGRGAESHIISDDMLTETINKQNDLSKSLASMIEQSLKVADKPAKSKPKPATGKSPAKSKSPTKPAPSRKPPSSQTPKPKPSPKPRPAPNIDDESDKKEFFESESELSDKLDTLAQWIKESKHCIVFTGAGISTSTGIPDFRSGMNTVLKTGPGKWELQAKGVTPSKASTRKSVVKAIPSVAHMSLVKLREEGLVKFIVSQNTDGLHLRSGIKPEQLAELHGNTNLEACSSCGAKYLRDFRTRSSKSVHDHRTSRKCDNLKCRGTLVDSIINFGEDLPEKDLERGFEEAAKSDLCIVLGSSLRVTPAADIPESVMTNGERLVICNLQKTPLNYGCALEIHSQIDDVMVGVMKRLGLEIPQFIITRRLAVDVMEKKISIQGLDVARDTPYSFLHQAEIKIMQRSDSKVICKELLSKEPYTVALPTNVKRSSLKAEIILGFQGHYGEPDATLCAQINKSGRIIYMLSYSICDRIWDIQEISAQS